MLTQFVCLDLVVDGGLSPFARRDRTVGVRPQVTMRRHPPVPSSLLKNLATQFILAATYVLAGKIGLTLALLNSSATAVWPPTGIALAAVLILGPRRAWLGIFVGAFLVNEMTAGSLLTSLAIACGNTGEALVGGYLVNRFAGGRTGFVRSGNLFLFAGLAGVLSTTVSATIGVTTLYVAGYATSAAYGSIWTTWWLGDAAGAMLVAPAVLLWHAAPRPQWSRQQQLEILILGLTTVLVAWTVFVRATHALPILCVPVCVWAGLRFGQREASTTACALSAIAVWGTLRGHGALASDSLNTELLLLQVFMATTSLIGLVVGGAVEESKRAALEARRLNDELEQRVQARTAELQAAYDHLVTSDAQLKEAQELAHVGSWEWNVTDNSAWWSEELYRICGTNPESFTPNFETFMGLLLADDRGKVTDIVQKAFADRQPFQCEHRIVRSDDGVRVMHSLGRVVVNDAGRVVRMVGVSQDITNRKQLEKQLRRAQQMEAVGQLAGGIAHDFNNLLTAISGFTEFVLLTLDETDSRRADLIEVRKASARAASLTRRLLAFSRRQILQTKVFDLNSLVSDIQKLLNRTIGENIELVLAFDAALEPVRADPSQLEQVVLNLALNARDAMPKGGQLRFVTEMVDIDKMAAERRSPMPPGRYVRLTITDTGTGMSPEIQQHMFEPFFTTKDRNKGTGLGLATVYGIVEQSGGYVSVTSRVGLGTSFEIYLPPVQEAVEPLMRLQESASLTGGTETVLLAEDDGAVRRLAGIALRHHGYTVLEARDGEEALQVARSDRRREIHLLVTDVVMPGLSGRDLALQLAADRPEIRVLYTSGYVEAITMRAGLERGATLLAKPFLPNDLVQRVRETLDSTAHPSFGELQLHDWMSSPGSVRSSGSSG